jgi:PAS domain S-box-containing protein
MFGNSQSWFYPTPTGDVSRDRNARTLQFSCLLFASALGVIALLDAISVEQIPIPIPLCLAGLAAATTLNRAGKLWWAGHTFFLTLTLCGSLLVIEAHDGFRSHAMLVFPGLLLISVMLFDRRSYLITAVVVVFTVAALGIAEKQGLTQAIPGIRSPTTLDSILNVSLILAVVAIIGSRIVKDVQADVFDLRASIAQLSAAHVDLTKIAEALRESEERFRLATKATMDAIWDIDLKTGKVGWNDTYASLYGRPPETSDSLQWWIDNIHAEDRERTLSHLQATIGSDASSWTCEYRFLRVDGEWAHIYDRAYIARDASGKARRVIGAMQDLTERKQAEARVRESEERFRRVFEEGPLGLGLIGRDYRFIRVNSALCQMVGYPPDELVQKTFADITHPDDVHNDVELAERLFEGEIPFYQMQKRYVKKNGQPLWINLTASVLRDFEGSPLYGLAMVEFSTRSSLRNPRGAVLALRWSRELCGTWAERSGSRAILARAQRLTYCCQSPQIFGLASATVKCLLPDHDKPRRDDRAQWAAATSARWRWRAGIGSRCRTALWLEEVGVVRRWINSDRLRPGKRCNSVHDCVFVRGVLMNDGHIALAPVRNEDQLLRWVPSEGIDAGAILNGRHHFPRIWINDYRCVVTA